MPFTEEFAKLATPNQVIVGALTGATMERLKDCTNEQRSFFARLFPEWPDRMTEQSLRTALDLCNRTVAKNRAGRSVENPVLG